MDEAARFHKGAELISRTLFTTIAIAYRRKSPKLQPQIGSRICPRDARNGDVIALTALTGMNETTVLSTGPQTKVTGSDLLHLFQHFDEAESLWRDAPSYVAAPPRCAFSTVSLGGKIFGCPTARPR